MSSFGDIWYLSPDNQAVFIAIEAHNVSLSISFTYPLYCHRVSGDFDAARVRVRIENDSVLEPAG